MAGRCVRDGNVDDFVQVDVYCFVYKFVLLQTIVEGNKMESSNGVPNLWVMREPEPLGSLLRPYHRDFPHLANLVASGAKTGTGVIVDGRQLPYSTELREALRAQGQESVLDTLGVEIASPGGLALPAIKALPWLPRRRYSAAMFSADERTLMCEEIARVAVDAGFGAVLVPARYIQDIHRDEVAHDVETAIQLRSVLDAVGGRHVRLYYPLNVGVRLIGSATARQGIVSTLQAGISANAIDALWIRAVGFDSRSGPVNVRRYVDGARGLHSLGVPIVGDRAGTLGLAMLALGAVTAISSGITVGERFDPRPLYRPPTGKPFLPAPRVYVPAIGAFMNRDQAEALLRHPSVKNWFACQRSCCAARGLPDTIADPRRHFIISRAEEVVSIARVPEQLRASQYMEKWLRPASDRATKAMRLDPALGAHRDRLDAWRSTLAAIVDEDANGRSAVSRSPTKIPTRRGAETSTSLRGN